MFLLDLLLRLFPYQSLPASELVGEALPHYTNADLVRMREERD